MIYSGAASRSEWTGVILPSVVFQPHWSGSNLVSFPSWTWWKIQRLWYVAAEELLICRWKNFRVNRSFVCCNLFLKSSKSEGIKSMCWFACVEANESFFVCGNYFTGADIEFSNTTAWHKLTEGCHHQVHIAYHHLGLLVSGGDRSQISVAKTGLLATNNACLDSNNACRYAQSSKHMGSSNHISGRAVAGACYC